MFYNLLNLILNSFPVKAVHKVNTVLYINVGLCVDRGRRAVRRKGGLNRGRRAARRKGELNRGRRCDMWVILHDIYCDMFRR